MTNPTSGASHSAPPAEHIEPPLAQSDAPSFCVFDVETKRLAQSVGGWKQLINGAGGISCVVVWDSRTNWPSIYGENQLGECIDHLESADFVFSWNGERFDVPVLGAVSGRPLRLRSHLDLWKMMVESGGGFERKGSRLGTVASLTIGEEKSGSGADVERLVEDGEWMQIANYCGRDVYLLKSLVEFVRTNGYLVAASGERAPISLPPRLCLNGR